LICGLVVMRLLELVSLVAVAGEACRNRVRLQEARRLAGVRIVAGNAITLRAGVLDLRLLDLLRLLAVTSDAQSLGVALGQHDLAILCRRMARFAAPAFEWRMGEGLQQMRLRRLVRIVTLHAIGSSKWLPLMRLDQGRVLRVVAVKT